MTFSNTHLLKNEQDTRSFGAKIASICPKGTLIFLYGGLGAGKTTLTRGFLQGLGYQQKVKSPSYTLVEPYEFNEKKVFHFDFYRLQDWRELEQIGINEYFQPDAICLIEWPDHGGPLLPPPDLACYIEIKDSGREIRLEASSLKGEEVLRQLQL